MYQNLVLDSINDVNIGLDHLKEAFELETEINKQSKNYKPKLLKTRSIQREIKVLITEIKNLKVEISRLQENNFTEKNELQNLLSNFP